MNPARHRLYVVTGQRLPRRGASVIEFALLIPVFLLLALAMVELSFVLYVRHAMIHAARDAVRSLAIREVNSAGSVSLASSRLAGFNIPFTITATPDSDTGLDRWVEVTSTYSDASLGDPLGILGGGNLTVRITMRGEG